MIRDLVARSPLVCARVGWHPQVPAAPETHWKGRISVMIDGARELSPIARAAAVLAPRAVSAPVNTVIPVILRATEAESIGARMRVGGMRIVDRAIRQLARLRDARVIIATDGSIPLPRRLPPNIERRDVAAASAIAALEH